MTGTTPICVILIDDHRYTHKAVATVLATVQDVVLVAQGSNGEEALQLCAEHQPDVVLMDVVMPVMDGIEATRQIHRLHPQIKILVLSSFQDDESVRAMLQNGAVGYILKSSLANDLIDTIRVAYAGKTVFSSEVAQTLLNTQKSPQATFDLTQREMEVLRAMAAGLNNQEIADRLTISASTVKFHIVNILHKLKVETRAEAIVVAAKNNLV